MTKYALMIKQMQMHFKESFCNLANNSVAELPPSLPPSNRFGLNTVRNYYQDT